MWIDGSRKSCLRGAVFKSAIGRFRDTPIAPVKPALSPRHMLSRRCHTTNRSSALKQGDRLAIGTANQRAMALAW